LSIRVQLFALAKEIVGCGHVEVAIEPGATVRELKVALVEQCPTLERLVAVSRFAVDGSFAGDETKVFNSNEIVFIPPVSGG
jgi:molybdopterin converting factor small subunit